LASASVPPTPVSVLGFKQKREVESLEQAVLLHHRRESLWHLRDTLQRPLLNVKLAD
jgi:hypothetical protein